MPALDLPALKKQIAARRLSPLHVFVGHDVRLMKTIVDAVEATVDPADQPFAVDHVYAGEGGGAPIEIVASAQVLPMLGDRRIVIVLRAERLLKPKRAARGEVDGDEADEEESEQGLDMTPLEDYVAKPAGFTTLLFVASDVDKGRRFTKRLFEKAHITEFTGLEAKDKWDRDAVRRAAEAQLRDELTRAGRTIDPDALHVLVDRAGGDISKLRGDVERLLLFTEGRPAITRTDIEEVSAAGIEIDDWAVINAIGDGNVAHALREVAARLDRGDSPHMLVGQLRWWVSTRLAEGAPDCVKPALDALLRTDLALKSSGGELRPLIERLVIELTGRPIGRQGSGYGRR